MKKICFLLFLLPALVHAQTITTIAGNGIAGFSGDGGPAIYAEFEGPAGTAIDTSGNVYVADYGNNRIRKISYPSGEITTIAGSGAGAYSGDGGPAIAAAMYYPDGIALDASGDLYIADQDNHRVRKINAVTGIITTVAGNGTGGFNGDGIAATASELYYPAGVALDAAGDLYIADWYNERIRKVTMSTGIISTIAGTGVAGFSGYNVPATDAKLYLPSDLVFDTAGNLYFSEYGNSTVRKVAASTGIITTIAGTGVAGYSLDGGPASTARLDQPLSLAVDIAGNVYIGDWDSSNRVRIIYASTGIIGTVAGNGTEGYAGDNGPATAAKLNAPDGLALDANDNLYISDELNQVMRKVTCPICAIESVPFVSKTHTLVVYPDPVQNELTISSSDNITSIAIINLPGQVIYNHEYNAQQVQVDVADLPAGTYLVKVNNTEVRKFIKQ